MDKIRRSLGNVAESTGRPLRFFLPDWMAAWARYTSGILDGEDDLAEPDADSPWLEEKRKWSALRERSRYETEIKQVVPIDEVHRGYGLVAGHWRRAAEGMCDVCKGLAEAALDDADADVDRVFSDSAGDDSDD